MSSPSSNQIIIGHELLSKIAGESCFQQGLEDIKKQSIDHFYTDSKSASAIIASHKVSITYIAGRVEGACDCSESEGFEFCRHCVSLTLHANKMAQQILSLSKGPDKSKILAYLLAQEKQSLAKQCLSLIENDSEQFERYLLKVSLSKENINYSDLKAQITDLTRKQDSLFSQRQVKVFFGKIERFLSELSLVTTESEPEKLIKVIEYTFHRINKLLHSVDDASEQRFECISLLRQLHSSITMQTSGRAETKAKRLYTLWLADDFDLIEPDLSLLLLPDAQKKFVSLVRSAWNKSLSHQPAPLTSLQHKRHSRFLLECAIEENNAVETQKYRDALA